MRLCCLKLELNKLKGIVLLKVYRNQAFVYMLFYSSKNIKLANVKVDLQNNLLKTEL